ncbi:MAG: serine/threonine-protein phosphatase [Oscillospiraceae bacterium]|nr:serine/threonine-protein phosphatase [Oscillospiraceae bacterium]
MKEQEYQTLQYDCGQSVISVCVHSDIGDRSAQEDNYTVAENGSRVFAAVCDGMGGIRGGAAASRAAAECLTDAFDRSTETGAAFFTDHLDDADAAVYFLKDENGKRLGCGTTIVSVLIYGDKLNWLSVGDSRLYLFRGSEMVQATADHNYGIMLDQLLADGEITQEQYDEEIPKHAALTSYLGIGGVKIYDISTEPLILQDGDLLLLTSDGLYHAFDVRSIAEIASQTPAEIAEKILQSIAEHPTVKRDNTTFILLQYSEKK